MRIPNFKRSLLAVLIGNLIYFAVMPELPYVLQHRFPHIDVGLLLDFLICTVLYICFGRIERARRPTATGGTHA